MGFKKYSGSSSKMLMNINGSWVFGRGKYPGMTMEEVIKLNPSYVKWVFNDASEGMDDEQFYALQSAMENAGLFKEAKSKRRVH